MYFITTINHIQIENHFNNFIKRAKTLFTSYFLLKWNSDDRCLVNVTIPFYWVVKLSMTMYGIIIYTIQVDNII